MQPIPTQLSTLENASAISSVVGMKPTTSTAAQSQWHIQLQAQLCLQHPQSTTRANLTAIPNVTELI